MVSYLHPNMVHSGLTYLSTSEAREVSLGLGSYWSTSLTVGLCPPNLNTHDILFTTDSGVLTGYTISSSYQTVLLTAGPLYLEDMSDVHAQVLTNSGYVTYPSIFTITIEGIATLPHSLVLRSVSPQYLLSMHTRQAPVEEPQQLFWQDLL